MILNWRILALAGAVMPAMPLVAQAAPLPAEPLPVETGPAEPAEPPKADWELYGFAQLDLISDFGGRMNPDWADAFRPSRIATPEGQFGSNGEFRASPKQSRLGFKANGEGGGKPWEGKFEFDMFGVGEDAGKIAVRLRHAYGSWGPILGGQTNSLFMDGDIFPNVIDYWGPAGMVFLRTAQLRLTFYDKDGLTLATAAEFAQDDIDGGAIRLIDEDLASNLRGKNTMPDFTFQARYGEDWGHVQVAGILRRIGYETLDTPDNEPKGANLGWGINATGVYTLGKATFRGGVVYGQGIASYMNDGGMDLAPTVEPIPRPTPLAGEGTLPPPIIFDIVDSRAVPLLGISAYVDLAWTEKLSSSFGYSQTSVDNTNFQTGDAFHKGQYASGNLLWTPIKRVMTGAELLWGQRTNNDGTQGDDIRLQFSFKVSFSSKDFLRN